MKYNVVELFDSIDGEGIRTGQAVTFIRLAGCNLRCGYCDTLYALFGEKEPCRYTEMSLEEILQKVNPQYRRITLTGGEPLLHPGADLLVSRLLEDGYEVNIETNGALSLPDFLTRIQKPQNLFFTVDYKLPSSKMEDKMLWENFTGLRPQDVVKFVVGSEEDVQKMLAVMGKMMPLYKKMPHIFIGTVYGDYPAQRLVETILSEPLLKDARYQVQLHKIIWDPEKRGV